jgi:hypothetical protein
VIQSDNATEPYLRHLLQEESLVVVYRERRRPFRHHCPGRKTSKRAVKRLRAHTEAAWKEYSLWETLKALNRPRVARTDRDRRDQQQERRAEQRSRREFQHDHGRVELLHRVPLRVRRVRHLSKIILVDAVCPVQFWSVKCLNWSIVTRAHVPRHTAAPRKGASSA